MRKVTIALPDEQAAVIEDAVSSGAYRSPEEVVLKAVRDWQTSFLVEQVGDEELARLWDEGLASGPPVDGEAALEDLRQRYLRRAGPSS